MTSAGDCFATAWRVASDLTLDDSVSDVRIVHALARWLGEGPAPEADGRFWHAWVEATRTLDVPVNGPGGVTGTLAVSLRVAIDRSNGRDVETAAEVMRRFGHVEPEHAYVYTLEQAVAFAAAEGHYGPWGVGVTAGEDEQEGA